MVVWSLSGFARAGAAHEGEGVEGVGWDGAGVVFAAMGDHGAGQGVLARLEAG